MQNTMVLDLIILLLVFAANLSLGFLVLLNNPKSKRNRTFFWLNVAVICWAAGLFLANNSSGNNYSLFGSKLAFASASSIAYFLYCFSWLFVEKDKRLSLAKKAALILPWLAIVCLALGTNYIVKDVEFLAWGTNAVHGPLYYLFVAYFVLYVILALVKLIKGYQRAVGIEKVQLKYLFLGFLLAVIFGSCTNLIIPIITGSSILSKFGPLATIFLLGFAGYAITRYRLMNIRIIMGRTTVYVLSFLLVIGFDFLLMFLNNQLAQPIPFNIFFTLVIITSILLFQLSFRFFKRIASKHFYYTFYSYERVLSDLGQRLTEILDLKKLSSLIINVLINTMKLNRAVVLLREKNGSYTILNNIGFREENGISLVKDNFLTRYLQSLRKPLVYEELSFASRDARDKQEKQNLEQLQENMRRIEADVCLPLFQKENITGIIILGKKISGEAYSKEDIDLLISLSSQSAIALQNARLYDEVQDLSQNLQEKVKQQTKELQKAYEEIKKAYQTEKRAHKELRRLDKVKSQFILATQHHLRTPLTAMRGYLDLLLGGSYGKIVNEKVREAILKFQAATNRLNKVVAEFLDISRFQLGKPGVSLRSNVDVELILKEIMERLRPVAENKGIYLRLKESKKRLPKIEADPEKLKQAISNIVDNGIEYTEKGGVDVKYQISNNKYQIIVSDTGIGLTKEETERLFTGIFERGEMAEKVYTTGRGIGLFIAYNTILAHGGKIWAESPGKGKGSTFYIELPLN